MGSGAQGLPMAWAAAATVDSVVDDAGVVHFGVRRPLGLPDGYQMDAALDAPA